jgi:hypothetical protein
MDQSQMLSLLIPICWHEKQLTSLFSGEEQARNGAVWAL